MSYVTSVLADSPSVFLKLDDATTSFADTSGNAHVQAITGTVTAAQPGVSTEISASALLGGGRIDEDFGSATAYSDLALEMWFKTSNASGTLWTSRGTTGTGFTLFMGVTGAGFGTAGKLSFGIDGAGVYQGVETTEAFNDNLWHHVVAVFSRASGTIVPSDFSIYVDGVLQTITERPVAGAVTVPVTSSRNWTIGQHLAGWSGTFSAAYVNAATVYPTALTAGQVTTHWAEMTATMSPTRSVIAESSLEVMTVPVAVPVVLGEASLEVMTLPAFTPVVMHETYMEVLSIVQPQATFIGWGMSI